jgi:hypothetical protein
VHGERVRVLVPAEPDVTIAELRYPPTNEEITTSCSGLGHFVIAAGLTTSPRRAFLAYVNQVLAPPCARE